MQDHVRGFLADHDDRSVRIPAHQRRHDGRIGDSEADNSVDFELVVDHRPGVLNWTHLTSADVVVDGVGVVSDYALPVVVGERLVVLAERIRVAEKL